MTNNTTITKDLANKKLHVTRSFAAGADLVWRAWTEAELLDKWWAPRPWKAETKSIDFKPGGVWLYSMVGPEGERNWCRVDITAVTPKQSFAADTTFSDEHGNAVPDFPVMHWHTKFNTAGDNTTVEVEISFDKEEDLLQIVEMGFEQGFTMALGNLDEVLA